MEYQEFEEYCGNDVENALKISRQIKEEKFKRTAKIAGVLVFAGAAYVYGKRKGFDKGYNVGYTTGELMGFKDAVKSITDGAVDLYNLGGLEE